MFLDASDICTTQPLKKLSHRYLGPFEVIRPIGSHAYRLRLPHSMSRIHPVFHVSQLEPHFPNTIPNRVQSPPPPVEVEGKEEYLVTEVLDSKIDRRRHRCPLLYYIQWQGYKGTDQEFEWILATTFC